MALPMAQVESICEKVVFVLFCLRTFWASRRYIFGVVTMAVGREPQSSVQNL